MAEFKSYSYEKDKFIFVVDPSEKVASLNQQIRETKTKLNLNIESLRFLKNKIKSVIQNSLKIKVDFLQDDNIKNKVRVGRSYSI